MVLWHQNGLWRTYYFLITFTFIELVRILIDLKCLWAIDPFFSFYICLHGITKCAALMAKLIINERAKSEVLLVISGEQSF